MFLLQVHANGDERVVCCQGFLSITSERVQHLAHFARTSPTPPVDKRVELGDSINIIITIDSEKISQ